MIVCGTVVGAFAGAPSGDGVRTVTQAVTRPGKAAQPQPTSPRTGTDRGGIAITPPAAVDAPDTLKELHDSGRVENTTFAVIGPVTIDEKTYQGVSMPAVDRTLEIIVGTVPRFVINTKGRYKRMKGVVGISDHAQCAENDANVSIANGNGERLWGPERVELNAPKRFDVSIRDRARVTLDQLSLPSGDNPCNVGLDPYLAWGDVEFVK